MATPTSTGWTPTTDCGVPISTPGSRTKPVSWSPTHRPGLPRSTRPGSRRRPHSGQSSRRASGWLHGASLPSRIHCGMPTRRARLRRPQSVSASARSPSRCRTDLSAFLRLPPALRLGDDVAVGPEEIERTALLADLARSGPRAGAHLIASIDHGIAPPRGFDLAEPQSLGINLRCKKGEWRWDDGPREHFVLPEPTPPAGRATAWPAALGFAAAEIPDSVPFSRIVVPTADRWTGVSTDGSDVLIGVDDRGEPQRFVLGRGNVHHALIGGDVQRGKRQERGMRLRRRDRSADTSSGSG